MNMKTFAIGLTALAVTAFIGIVVMLMADGDVYGALALVLLVCGISGAVTAGIASDS